MGKRLYVGNLSFETTEATLTAEFGRDGRRVSSVSIVTDRDTGRPRGFAFVTISDDAAARAAIDALNGTELDGRTINVNEAKARTDAPGGGRGGPRGGGGGGGGRGGPRGGGGRRDW